MNQSQKEIIPPKLEKNDEIQNIKPKMSKKSMTATIVFLIGNATFFGGVIWGLMMNFIYYDPERIEGETNSMIDMTAFNYVIFFFFQMIFLWLILRLTMKNLPEKFFLWVTLILAGASFVSFIIAAIFSEKKPNPSFDLMIYSAIMCGGYLVQIVINFIGRQILANKEEENQEKIKGYNPNSLNIQKPNDTRRQYERRF